MGVQISTVDGIREAAFTAPMWRGMGAIVEGAPNSEEMIRAAHLDWRVGMRPVQMDNGVEIPGKFATYREDTGRPLGVVGSKYNVVQNRDAFNFLDGLQQDGILKYDSAGAIRGGGTVWVVARMPSIDEIAPGDKSARYILFQTSHDGSGSIHAIPISFRLTCANMLRAATMSDIGIRHTGDLAGKLNQARKYLSQFDQKFTLFRDKSRRLAESRWTPDQAREYIETLFPEVKAPGRAQTIREKKVAAVRAAMRNPRNTLPAIKGTWWALLNSVTETVDHDKRRSYATEESRETRLTSLTSGAGADFKARAWDVAIAMSA